MSRQYLADRLSNNILHLLGGGRRRQHLQQLLLQRRFVTTTTTTITKAAAATTTLLPHRCYLSSSISNTDHFDDYHPIESLPWQFLRAYDSSNYDPMTFQRCDVTFDIHNGKMITSTNNNNNNSNNQNINQQGKNTIDSNKIYMESISLEPNQHHSKENSSINNSDNDNDDDDYYYKVVWSDGVISKYSVSWIQQTWDRWQEGQKLSTTTTSFDDNDDDDNNTHVSRVFWSQLTEEKVRNSSLMSLKFSDLIHTNGKGMHQALKSLYKYGLVLITETPVNDNGAGIAALGAALSGGKIKDDGDEIYMNGREEEDDDDDGSLSQQKQSSPSSLLTNYRLGGTDIILPHGTDGPLRTLYGTVWSTTATGQADGASIADSAYGNEALPLHTDMTYLRDPPGLQIFASVQTAMESNNNNNNVCRNGESIFADGFAIAQRLRETNPKAFHILSTTIRRYRCIDETTGWHLEASGPIIMVENNDDNNNGGRGHNNNNNNNNGGGENIIITGIRHNDLDRLPDLPPRYMVDDRDEMDRFYQQLDDAHKAWDELLSKDEFRLVFKLQPGETMVVANQRCFHGRFSFQSSPESPRSVTGCYISQDELNSRFRMEGFDI